MRLALVLTTIITLCQLITTLLMWDTWRMDKQFFDENYVGNETEEVIEEVEV